MNWTPGTPVELHTEHFILRSLESWDIDQRYADWWNDPQVMEGIARPDRNTTVEEQRRRLAKVYDNRKNFQWGIFERKEGRLVGFVDILCTPYHRTARMNTVIGERELWGQNVLMELSEAGMIFIFETLGMAKITGRALARNFATVYINKAMGLSVEAVLRGEWRYQDGKRVDVLAFGLLREDWRARRQQDRIEP